MVKAALTPIGPSSTWSRALSLRRHRAKRAALATTSEEAVSVNAGSDASLRQRLGNVKQLPVCVVDRIVALRPFNSKQDMLQRVNEGRLSARQCIGRQLARKLHVGGVECSCDDALLCDACVAGMAEAWY